MIDTIFFTSPAKLRRTDTNSLLRLYDEINGAFQSSPSSRERARAEKFRKRLVLELNKRDVPLNGGPN